jgi:hypothetical protein
MTKPSSVVSRWLTVAALSGIGLGAASAASADSFVIGQGRHPQVAVDAAGTAYVVWNRQMSGGGRAVDLCRLPRGATTCAVRTELTPEFDAFSSPYVFLPAPGVVQVVTNRCCYAGPNKTLLYTSTNSGASFQGPVQIGTLDPSGDAILGPGNAISAITADVTAGTFFQRSSLDGSGVAAPEPRLSRDRYGGTVGLVNGSLVAAFWDFEAGVPPHLDFSVFSGLGDASDAASWTSPALATQGKLPRIASGPAGLFLMYQPDAPGEETPFFVRRFNGAFFGDPLAVSGTEVGTDNDLFEDPSGRLHALWRTPGGDLRYAGSPDAAQWTAPATLTSDAQGALGPQVATAPDGIGVAVWQKDREGDVSVGEIPPSAKPVAGKTVGVRVVSGAVSILPPSGKGGFTELKGAASVRIGSTVDTTRGRVALTSAADLHGRTQRAEFYAGKFQVRQQRKSSGMTTDLKVRSSSFGRLCLPKGNRSRASAALSKRRLGRLFGNGKGRFRTRGRFAAATVRGTIWLTEERCDGTRISVRRGKVSVVDQVRGKKVTVSAGHSYTARATRAAIKRLGLNR